MTPDGKLTTRQAVWVATVVASLAALLFVLLLNQPPRPPRRLELREKAVRLIGDGVRDGIRKTLGLDQGEQ